MKSSLERKTHAPRQINMEHMERKNRPFEKDNHLNQNHHMPYMDPIIRYASSHWRMPQFSG